VALCIPALLCHQLASHSLAADHRISGHTSPSLQSTVNRIPLSHFLCSIHKLINTAHDKQKFAYHCYTILYYQCYHFTYFSVDDNSLRNYLQIQFSTKVNNSSKSLNDLAQEAAGTFSSEDNGHGMRPLNIYNTICDNQLTYDHSRLRKVMLWLITHCNKMPQFSSWQFSGSFLANRQQFSPHLRHTVNM